MEKKSTELSSALGDHLSNSQITALQNASSVVRSGGKRAVNNVRKICKTGKAVAVQPLKGTPLGQKMDDYMAAYLNKNTALQGQLGEEMSELIFKEADNLSEIINGKINASDNGFDRIQFIPNRTNPTTIRIIESKPVSGASVVLEGTTSGTQMGTGWIDNNIDQMLNAGGELEEIGMILLQNRSKIERFAVGIDKNFQQLILLKLEIFQ